MDGFSDLKRVTLYQCDKELAYKATSASHELLVPRVLRWKWHLLILKSNIWTCRGITAQCIWALYLIAFP